MKTYKPADQSQDEMEFLRNYDANQYERVSVTNDVLIFTTEEKKREDARKNSGCGLQILLIRRKEHPFREKWAVPGGFVRPEESLTNGAVRRLQEETGIQKVYLEQLYTYGEPDRDPRTRVISVANMALIPKDSASVRSEAQEESSWFWVNKRLISSAQKEMETIRRELLTLTSEDGSVQIRYELVERTERSILRKMKTEYLLLEESTDTLAFDHVKMIDYALERLRNKLEYTPVAVYLLPELFTVKELQNVYEAILGREILNFRRKIGTMILETDAILDGRPFRPAKLYKYNVNWEHEFLS